MSDNRLSANQMFSNSSSNPTTTPRRNLASLGPFAQSGVVAGVVAVLWIVLAPLAHASSATAGLIALAVAAGVCLLGAELAVAIGWLFRGRASAMYALLLGMTVRMMVPLFLGVALHVTVPALADASMMLYLIVFYLAALATETVLVVAQIRPQSRQV